MQKYEAEENLRATSKVIVLLILQGQSLIILVEYLLQERVILPYCDGARSCFAILRECRNV